MPMYLLFEPYSNRTVEILGDVFGIIKQKHPVIRTSRKIRDIYNLHACGQRTCYVRRLLRSNASHRTYSCIVFKYVDFY